MKINKIYFISVFLLSFFLILINFSDFSRGADEIIFYSIPAEAILDIKSLREFLEVITYGFFYEDHLSPLTNIFSPIILLFIGSNILTLFETNCIKSLSEDITVTFAPTLVIIFE